MGQTHLVIIEESSLKRCYVISCPEFPEKYEVRVSPNTDMFELIEGLFEALLGTSDFNLIFGGDTEALYHVVD